MKTYQFKVWQNSTKRVPSHFVEQYDGEAVETAIADIAENLHRYGIDFCDAQIRVESVNDDGSLVLIYDSRREPTPDVDVEQWVIVERFCRSI